MEASHLHGLRPCVLCFFNHVIQPKSYQHAWSMLLTGVHAWCQSSDGWHGEPSRHDLILCTSQSVLAQACSPLHALPPSAAVTRVVSNGFATVQLNVLTKVSPWPNAMAKQLPIASLARLSQAHVLANCGNRMKHEACMHSCNMKLFLLPLLSDYPTPVRVTCLNSCHPVGNHSRSRTSCRT